jgi:hypothetical protein
VSDPKIEWTLDDKPLDITYLKGLSDIQGTFTGRMDMDSGLTELFSADGVQTIYIYGPRSGNLIQHWFWTIRERLFGIAYPSEIIFSGPAEFNMKRGTFTWPPGE